MGGKPKFRIDQVVSFKGSGLIFGKIIAIAEYGFERQFTIIRDGLRVQCNEADLRCLTAREIGPRARKPEKRSKADGR